MPVLQPPPFRVYLMRHARAAWPADGERDFDRHLDDVGYAEVEIVGANAADKGYKPDIVLSSTAVRCRETAQSVRRAFNDAFDVTYVDEMYNAQPETYLALIAAQAPSRSVMLIGHNPTLDAVAEAFMGQRRMESLLPSGFPTAGLAVLDAKLGGDGTVTEWQMLEFLAP